MRYSRALEPYDWPRGLSSAPVQLLVDSDLRSRTVELALWKRDALPVVLDAPPRALDARHRPLALRGGSKSDRLAISIPDTRHPGATT